MFLDPDPKGREKTTRVSSPSSPFFASQSPHASPRLQGEQSWRIKRSPAQDSSPTFKNSFQRRSTSTGDDGKSTVRLVGHSPVSPIQSGSSSEYDLSRKQDWFAGSHAPRPTSLLASSQPASGSETGSPAASRVSEVQAKIARAQQQDLPHIVTLLPSTYSKLHSRRSTSSKYSGTGTTNSTEAFDSLFTGSDSGRSGRLSGRSTLYEEEIPEIGDENEGSHTVHPKGSALETVRETSPDQSTAPSVSTEYQGQSSDTARESQSLPLDYSPSSPHRRPEEGEDTQYSPQESLGSLPASSLSLPRSPTRLLTGQDSRETLAYDPYDYQQTSSSSGNFIAYSDSTSPNSPESPLHNAGSLDSIQARLGTPSAFRPTTSSSADLDTTPTQTSPRHHHFRSLSADTVSPLQSPTRREQNQPRTRSSTMNALPASDDIDYEDIDLEPWPRNHFSSHLSTIASMSDRAMSPAQFSHFSMGSGVLTIDDACSIPMSGSRSRGSGALSSFSMSRRASEPLQSPSNKSTPEQIEEEAGDMTLGVYRAESAKPEPLFLGRQVTSTGDVRYDGPLPPLPPMPRSQSGKTDESGDRLSALSAPSLKKKRSGYSVRGRSNSTPSGNSRSNSMVSYCDSDRGSRGSNLFPLWAKNFYGGYAALLSASKISLHNPPTPRRETSSQPMGHIRNLSQRTQHSITSRLGTGYSEIENVSPTSSHFLPAIFRPRTRTLGASDGLSRKNSRRKASRSDSMAITSAPVDPLDPSGETLPSGHPKFGILKDDSSNQPPLRPLPRKYSKQKLWDEMSFPRPMTKDRLSDFGTHMSAEDSPHLRPNKRQASQINQWRSPSFVESYHTLFSSRGNRQILLFALGFLCPFFWLLGALLPLPPRPSREADQAEKALPNADSEDDLTSALNKHRSGDARVRWTEEKAFLKAKWWRTLNRVMCIVGIGIIAAIVALAIIATR